ACRGRCLVPAPGEGSRQKKQRSDEANIDTANACAIAARTDWVRRRPDSQIDGSARPAANLKTAAACRASHRYFPSPACSGEAADSTAPITLEIASGRATQIRAHRERKVRA